jgi:DNA polymerase-1
MKLVALPLLIVDGDNLAHRAYHSTPKTILGADGSEINALVGVISMLVKVWQSHPARGIFVAWDTLGVETYRNRLLPEYQGGRSFEPSIVRQLDLLPSLCESFGFGVAKQEGYECDDLAASAVRVELAAGGSCLLLTTDKDFYQLVGDRVSVLSPKRGAKEMDRIGPAEVVSVFGILPEQVPDFKALAGDPSDKIPGARGIGPKSAASMLLQHGTLEGVLETWGRQSENERILMYRDVARMRDDAKVTLPEDPPNWGQGASALRAIGAVGLADRVEKVQ